MKISKEAMKAAYEVAKRIREGKIGHAAGAEELHRRFSLNLSSAKDTISNIEHMLEGEQYTRTNNAFATEHFLEMIHRDYGLGALEKAVSAVEQHLQYYEAQRKGIKLLKIWKLVHKYRAVAKDEKLAPVVHQEPLPESAVAAGSGTGMLPNIPAGVRILPMDSKKVEFPDWSVEQVQTRWFLGEMPSPPHPGRYQFRERGLDAEPGTVVLFQFASQIIASAVFLKSERYATPDSPYRGALWFDPESIQVFEPVGESVIREIWPNEFTNFSIVKQRLDPKGFWAFELRLMGIETPPRMIKPDCTDLNDYAIENRKIEIEQRQKQSLFRARILQNFESRCCLSGISEKELLVASHIVPWAKRVETRLDPANGLLLYCPYDRLFDKGFISFDDSLRVVVAPWVGRCSPPLRAILEQLAGQQARRPVKWDIKSEYLAYHRTEVLQSHPPDSEVAAIPSEMA